MPKKPDIAITVTAAPRKRSPRRSPAKEVRHGAFTRIEDDPLGVELPPALLVGAFNGVAGIYTQSFDITRSPKSPKVVTIQPANLTARPKSAEFPNPLAVAYLLDTGNLGVLSLTKPRKPTIASQAVAPGPLTGIPQPRIEGAVAYWAVTTPSNAIHAFSLTDPTAAVAISTLDIAAAAVGQKGVGHLAVQSKRVYVPNFGTPFSLNSYLGTYNYDAPAAPTQLGVVLIETAAAASDVTQIIPALMADGVLYVGFCYRNNPIDDAYTTKLLTFSLASPDAPVLVNSVVVNTGTKASVRPVDRLIIDKQKAKLFLFTHNAWAGATSVTDELNMYNITTPAAPALLATLPVAADGAGMPLYARGDGVVYIGILNVSVFDIQIYDVSGGTFNLVNTILSDAALSAMLALDKQGFPL